MRVANGFCISLVTGVPLVNRQKEMMARPNMKSILVAATWLALFVLLVEVRGGEHEDVCNSLCSKKSFEAQNHKRNLCTGYAASVLKKAGRKEMGDGRRLCRNGCHDGDDKEVKEKREAFCKTYEENIKQHTRGRKPIQLPKDLI